MRDRIVPFMAHQLLNVTVETAADDVRAALAASEARDQTGLVAAMPQPVLNYDELQGRMFHEPGHCKGALDGHADKIEALIRPDGSGWCSYTPIANPLDAIRCHLAGFAAEAKAYPPALGRYVHGCYDFTAAKLLIDKYNADGLWPPLTCEAAARSAVEFVDSRWKQIRALALALGSAGSLTDYEIRLFSGCSR
jgi:hypothetical protein